MISFKDFFYWELTWAYCSVPAGTGILPDLSWTIYVSIKDWGCLGKELEVNQWEYGMKVICYILDSYWIGPSSSNICFAGIHRVL